MIIIFAGKYIAPLKFIFDNAYVVGSIGAGLAYFIYIKAAKEVRNSTYQAQNHRSYEKHRLR